MTKVKLCSFRRIEDAQAANLIKPDYVGFIFVEGRKRYIDPDKALELRKILDPAIKTVGVFIDEKPEKIAEIAAAGIIDMVQLHGSEDDAVISEVRRRTGLPVIKAFRIESHDDIDAAAVCTADHVLLDAGGGGTGTSFDWSLIADFPRDYYLAGGLTHENVEEAVRRLKPFAVDVSSGVETDGVKDPEKMRLFTEGARRAGA